MFLGNRLISTGFSVGLVVLVFSCPLFSQEAGNGPQSAPISELPDAPVPQLEQEPATPGQTQATADKTTAGSDKTTAGSDKTKAGQSSSAAQPAGQQPAQSESQHQKAEEQLKEEEQQRVVGVVPLFDVTFRPDAVSLTAGQKIRLALRSTVDPFTFASALMIAGYSEARGTNKGFGGGAAGFGKRSGAAMLDTVDDTMLGSGFLPALFHQDPRYFRLGKGTFTHRLLYSLATNVIAKHDNTGRWEPNYSNVLGNIAAGALSNLYYPASNKGIGLTISNGLIQTAFGGIGSVFDEFWPDLSRGILHKDPTHGLDAQAGAAGK